MSLEALTREVADLKRRLEIAETKLAQHAGQFEFISGQLRDVQLYLHERFDDIDKQFGVINAWLGRHDANFAAIDARFDRIEAKFESRFASLEAKVDALPRVLAEMLAKR